MSGTSARARLQVVAGVVRDASGRVLIAQRPAGRHLAGGWEFPGGKLEPGEGRRDGLGRELAEELGLTLDDARPLMRVLHSYPERDVELDAWLVTAWRGEPRGLDGQQLRWCAPDELPDAGLLPADVPIVTALRLPERIVATADRGFVIVPAADAGAARRQGLRAAGRGSPLLGVGCDGARDVPVALAAGADFIVMRTRLPAAALAAVCVEAGVPVYAHGVTLREAWEHGASGVSDLAG